MNVQGALIGLCAFLIIGVFHPIVIKCEYHFTHRVWPVFLVLGLLTLAASFFVPSGFLTAVLGVLGFTLLWSIRELFEQRERVEKGWFPENPKRRK